jgi:hypothetical protein
VADCPAADLLPAMLLLLLQQTATDTAQDMLALGLQVAVATATFGIKFNLWH